MWISVSGKFLIQPFVLCNMQEVPLLDVLILVVAFSASNEITYVPYQPSLLPTVATAEVAVKFFALLFPFCEFTPLTFTIFWRNLKSHLTKLRDKFELFSSCLTQGKVYLCEGRINHHKNKREKIFKESFWLTPRRNVTRNHKSLTTLLCLFKFIKTYCKDFWTLLRSAVQTMSLLLSFKDLIGPTPIWTKKQMNLFELVEMQRSRVRTHK